MEANEAPEYVYAYAAFAYFYSSVRHAITFIYSILARSHINSFFWLPKFRWLQKWKTKTKSKQQQQQYSERYCIIWNLLINSVKICMAESVRREQKIKRERARVSHTLSASLLHFSVVTCIIHIIRFHFGTWIMDSANVFSWLFLLSSLKQFTESHNCFEKHKRRFVFPIWPLSLSWCWYWLRLFRFLDCRGV